ncbi:MAG: TIGR02453 family protein [Gemmatimonadales bacterium]
MAWHVYVARCGDGTLYTGITTDPARREAAHNAGRGAAYTRSRLPVRLIYVEPAADRGTALRRELAIKRLPRPEKERLVTRPIPRPAPAPATSEYRGFRPAALAFLRRLARHNSREWFERHRAVYETEVRDPLRSLVEEMDVRLARLAPEITGDPRRSVFRIHRDVRFSADKSPYKTNAACQFYHGDAGRGAGQDAVGAGAGLYFQLADGECFVAGGIWMPARPALEKIREAVADDAEGLDAIVRAPSFRRRFKALDREAMLTRLPRGYAAGHPAERWLRFKSFTATRTVTEREATSPRLPALLERDFAALVPLVRWLNGAIGYRPWQRRY